MYAVQAECTEMIKIGVTEDVRLRLARLRAMSPDPLELLGVMPNVTVSDERGIHLTLAADRGHGEWFWPTERVEKVLRQHFVGPETVGLGVIA